MDKLLHAAFLKTVEQCPERIALVSGEIRLTYKELFEKAKIVAAYISSKITPNNQLVGVLLQKGWQQIVSVLGVVIAGGVYVPFDTNAPASRTAEIIKKSKLNLFITAKNYLNHVVDIETVQIGCFDEILSTSADLSFTFKKQDPNSLAYIIFTSGSTGAPKGVAIQHFAAVNTICDMNQRFHVFRLDSILGLSELNFDLSVFDIFGIFAVGGKLVLPTQEENRDPKKWLKLIQDEGITIWNTVPAFLSMFYEFNKDVELPKSLRLFLLSGDWISIAMIKEMKTRLPYSQYVSLGGATEASIWSVLYEINEIDPNWSSIPYGKAMLNQTIEVLDENFQPCLLGKVGEICIGGVGLAKEYWRDAARTSNSFVFTSEGRRLYKTGDFGRTLESGDIEFLGRKDFQVKINGYRIELGEIEALLCQLLGVLQAVAVVKNGIYAFLIPDQIDETVCLEHLKAHLPAYMIPRAVYTLRSFPLTLNGKIDRNALIDIAMSKSEKRNIITPRNEIEQLILAIWLSLLEIDQISVEDDFFEIGGDSLKAVQLVYQMNKRFSKSYPLSLIFESRSIALLAKKIKSDEHSSNLVKLSQTNGKRTLFVIHPVSGEIFCYYKLSQVLINDVSIYAIQADFVDTKDLTSLAKKYANLIRASKVSSPYFLAGWSIGGLIAFEVAKQLGEANVAYLGLIDTYPPFNLLLKQKLSITQAGLVQTIYNYYLQEIAKIIHGEVLEADMNRLAKIHPENGLETLKQMVFHKHRPVSEENTELINHFTNQFKVMLRLMIGYRPYGLFEGNVTFFKSEEMTADIANLWGALCKNLVLTDLNGDHLKILDEPNVQDLGQKLLSSY